MANEQNLIPGGHKFTLEEASKGGKNSGAARRARSDLRQAIREWLENDAGTDKHGQPITGAEMMLAVAVKEAMKGSARHWELIRDTGGFKPVDKVMVADVDPDVIAAVEFEVKEALRADGAENADCD